MSIEEYVVTLAPQSIPIQKVPPGVRATDTRGYCTHPRVQVPVVPILQAPPTIGRTTAKPCTATQVAHVLQKW